MTFSKRIFAELGGDFRDPAGAALCGLHRFVVPENTAEGAHQARGVHVECDPVLNSDVAAADDHSAAHHRDQGQDDGLGTAEEAHYTSHNCVLFLGIVDLVDGILALLLLPVLLGKHLDQGDVLQGFGEVTAKASSLALNPVIPCELNLAGDDGDGEDDGHHDAHQSGEAPVVAEEDHKGADKAVDS